MKWEFPIGNDDGFTIIEVLVSFMIVALVLASLLNAYSEGLSLIKKSQTAYREIMALVSLIDRVGADMPAYPGLHDGHLDNGQRWEIEISMLEDVKPHARFDVAPHRVEARLLDGNGSLHRRLSTVFLARIEGQP